MPVPTEKLLHIAFKEDELQYLSQHKVFQEELAKNPQTFEGFELLIKIGSLLLTQRDELADLLRIGKPAVRHGRPDVKPPERGSE